MKNIKDMFSNIFPDVPCRKRKDKESISQYLKDVYSILFTILKNKKTTENVKDYEKKLIAIRSAFKENEYLTRWGPGLLRLGAIMSFGGYCVSRPGLLRLGAVVG